MSMTSLAPDVRRRWRGVSQGDGLRCPAEERLADGHCAASRLRATATQAWAFGASMSTLQTTKRARRSAVMSRGHELLANEGAVGESRSWLCGSDDVG
jgi:hypothetical protein